MPPAHIKGAAMPNGKQGFRIPSGSRKSIPASSRKSSRKGNRGR